MTRDWRRDDLPRIADELASRPGHEETRTRVADIMRYGFDVAWIDQEVRAPQVRGRIDSMFGATLFEFKKDLRRELPDVLDRMPDYLGEAERLQRRRFLGIATDGAAWIAFELRAGACVEISRFELRPGGHAALLGWLGPVASERGDLHPDPLAIQRELGRDSLTYRRALPILREAWEELRDRPEVALKRDLWAGLLREVYGAPLGDDELFLQHTYLTIVAKTMAARVMELPAEDARSILSGEALAAAGILGAVESDFFDWVLESPKGLDLTRRIARQVARFLLRDARVDVLKALYESLIDPAQRHDLGEYYTPDWLAARLVERLLPEPLGRRVLDPACGSGTFLFHAIRRKLAAAAAAGWSRRRAVAACMAEVRGLDVHPVAAIIARVTWLLALGDTIRERPGTLQVPVYLGDAMQWNVTDVVNARAIVVKVPDSQPLTIPLGFAEDQARFDAGLNELQSALRTGAAPEQVRRAIRRIDGVTEDDARGMSDTYSHLLELYRVGRDGIWPFVLSNLRRPLLLSRADQRADVVVGNPPWVAFRHLSQEMQARLREASMRMDLWVGGVLTTQQDLCALFWARSIERYLKPDGLIGFVLPYAALNRPAFAGLRRGEYGATAVRFIEAWSFDEKVTPLFPVPASVMIATPGMAGPLPATVRRFTGRLPRRDAGPDEAAKALTEREDAWPPVPTLLAASPYRARFKQGATIVPRRFFFVDRLAAGRFGPNPAAPLVVGRAGKLDKHPWTEVRPPSGPVELQFLRPVLLGESLAPFRVLRAFEAVLPIERGALLDEGAAREEGYHWLANWLQYIDAAWAERAARRADGKPKMTLTQQLDHMRKLTQQLGPSEHRVAYSASGSMLTACVLPNPAMIVEHVGYWSECRSADEAHYVVAALNSSVVLEAVEPMMAKGQGGARHFDNLVWELPIPEYSARVRLHRNLAAAAVVARTVAASVPLEAGSHFTRQRRAIRDALSAHGIAGRIDAMVRRLLDGP